ncbi:hypothetical protein MATL_G00190590 [Megalops atlanticus]|uniref:Uncharacterized protein n=1 Tax=Megalops atlanticus TaxID=7932 RepID=A0A9D3PL76_MEGAT|nr:hypothetical protein MATL_G00190590 [Megalops atlanticus]
MQLSCAGAFQRVSERRSAISPPLSESVQQLASLLEAREAVRIPPVISLHFSSSLHLAAQLRLARCSSSARIPLTELREKRPMTRRVC